MGVVFQAIQREASPVMQCRDHKPQPATTITANNFALTTCPLLFIQDCVNKSLDARSLSRSSNNHALHISVTQSGKDQQPSLKRWACAVISSCRGVKRQRTAMDCSYRDSIQPDRASLGSPRSLQYALPGLSSHDTLHVLHAMRVIPSELRHLNGSASRGYLGHRCKVQQVFGWRHLLCQEEDDEKVARRVVWKCAKALDSMKMRPLARQIWRSSTLVTGGLSDGETGRVLYTVNDVARVVQSTKRQYGSRRRARGQVWIECFLDDGLQVCVARKELRQFDEYRAPDTSATECQGFLVRPIYTKAINARVAGCSLQCVQAVDARDCGVQSAPALKQQMINDLPRLTLQCEEDYVAQAPQLRETYTICKPFSTQNEALMELSSVAEEMKLSADLQRGIRRDTAVDIIVQLVSPSQVLRGDCEREESAELDRVQRASCVAESLQLFAGRTQQPVKDLLAQCRGHFSRSTFLWIDNSVAVKDASRELVLALAQLDVVEKIDLEQVLEVQIGFSN